MMYYLGAMQFIIKKIAIVMQVLMGTTAGESLNAAGNIFIGQVMCRLFYIEAIRQKVSPGRTTFISLTKHVN